MADSRDRASRNRSLANLAPRRVCLIKPSSLGDIVHALPVLGCLRDRWPEARFTWVVNRSLRGLVDGHPDLDEVIAFDRPRAGLGVRGLGYAWSFGRELRRHRFDLAIDLQGLLRSGLMSWATGARVRVGRADAREGAGRFYTHAVEASGAHAVDKLLAVAAAFGADVSSPRFQLPISEADRAWARATLSNLPRPRVVLNVGARWETKRWPPARFAAVARRAVDELGAGLIAVGAPEDRGLVNTLCEALAPLPVLDLCGQTSLARLAAVAEAADVVLSNDTGPLHLAAATGTRVVAVFTCTKPEWTGPYGPNARVVASNIWCAGSCVKTCDRLDCMSELSVGRVWSAVAELLRPAQAA